MGCHDGAKNIPEALGVDAVGVVIVVTSVVDWISSSHLRSPLTQVSHVSSKAGQSRYKIQVDSGDLTE